MALRLRLIVTAALALALLLLLLPGSATAHKPIIEGRDIGGYGDAAYLPDPDVSWAIYGFVEREGDVDYCSFDVAGGLNLSTNVLVPVKGVYREFRPSYAIIGPGIDASDPVPFEVPAGMGALVVDMPADSGEFYEPFGGVSYWQSPRNYTVLSKPGRYYIAVFDRDRGRGDYVLAVGERESFGLLELPRVLWNTLRIRLGAWDHSARLSK
jgi:hypothetical protein